MLRELDNYYNNQEEPNKSCLLALRELILSQHDDVLEIRKYGMPCFTIYKKAFCYLWTDKKTKEPYILFVEGERLLHPSLEKGSRSRMKILRITPNHDLPVKIIQSICLEALHIYLH